MALPNEDRPIPPAKTGSHLKDVFADLLTRVIQAERRIDPWLHPAFDATLRDPPARLMTAVMNARRVDEHLALAEEKPLQDEDACNRSIIETFSRQMAGLWQPGRYERGGNTKTHGIVRGKLIIREDLPAHLSRGVFQQARTFPALVRFSGPGPYITPDIDDVGFMSISVKLMDVPGPKVLDEESFTQDFLAVCTPTFVTPDIRANVNLQRAGLQNATIFYFLNLYEPHLLDLLMQGLWTKTQSSPLEAPYFSCVPYLLGEGQAMQYSFWPVSKCRRAVPNLPQRPPDDYLRLALEESLARHTVELEMRVQVQTDSFRMPLENAGVLWPEELSPRVPVATLRLPQQTVDYAAALRIARRLSFNPRHCIQEHRPLLLVRFLLWITDYAARHLYHRGNLARVSTIHFARWAFMDGGQRMLFSSIYDGSLESYMDDFINKVGFGLHATFSNGIGYPRTRWLLLDGCQDEQTFKRVLRRHQLPTEVWYNAHPGLTAANKHRNLLIRSGLEAASMSEQQAVAWLALI